MKNLLQTLCAIFLITALAFTATAQDEDFKISIQGTLKDANSLAVDDGQQTITFRLYDDMTGGTVKHEETADVQVRGGVYNYLLGTNEELEPEDFVTALYLSLEINGNELFPRTQMTYSPYSLSVSTAQQAIRLTSGTETCSGSVGDIKHSILNPTDFAEENGDCWVPMDGRAIPGTKLADTYGWSSVPDMSGLFVRATEYNEGNDPGRVAMSAPSVQADEFKEHQHTGETDNTTSTVQHGGEHNHLIRYSNGDTGHGNVADGSANDGFLSTQNDGAHSHTMNPHKHSFTTDNTGGAETRPKNMNFFIYIRVD
ncbi:MAG: hypothetical protein RIC19_24885 [Phaeodactylibacter sp.]|uniref:hypothetical protein n=1 Tax=Phaeodactylibacter sp. TaxID=1940289 RepID=UPI0032ED4947